MAFTIFTTASPSLFSQRLPHKHMLGKHHPLFVRVKCRTTTNDPKDSEPRNTNATTKEAKLQLLTGNRRDMLIGLGGLYAATVLANPNLFAFAAPALPDITKCQQFTLPPDPGNFVEQANIHCDYCDGGYLQFGFPKHRPMPVSGKITNSTVKAPVVALPKALDSKIALEVKREKKSRSKAEKEAEEEILVIEGIEFGKDEYVKFDVYVNDDEESGPRATEFAGSFVSLPHGARGKSKMKSRFQIGITELLEDIGADDDDELVLVLVPKSGKVTVNGPVRTELDSGC